MLGGGPARGICGSGLVDVTAAALDQGWLLPNGKLTPPNLPLADGVALLPKDFRALQLAKGAIHAGWELLMQSLDVPLEELDTVYVAGAFGNYLDLAAAQYLGLFPPVETERVAFVGNAAGVGAQMALIDVKARGKMAKVRDRIEFLDLATDKRFLEVFSGRLGFASD